MRQFLRTLVLKHIERYTARLLATHKPKVVAITGSVGKTTTKQAVAHVLRQKYKVLAHEGNYNTEFGMPLSLFELKAPSNVSSIRSWLKIFAQMRKIIDRPEYPYEVVVLEMGADKPGDIQRFMSYIQPDIGIVTAVAKVHMEEFRSIDAIFTEKWSLARGSKQALYNHDDPRLASKGERYPEAQGYGLSETEYWYDPVEFSAEAVAWRGTLTLLREQIDIELPVLSKQTLYSLVAATAVASKLGMDIETIGSALKKWQQPNGRMRMFKGKKDTIIIDDSYNASPFATVAALDSLSQFPGRKVAILGSMNELGEYEAKGHQLVGKHCGHLSALATIGYAANKYLVPAALGAGLTEEAIHECNSPYQAGEQILSELEPGDVVLVKGSQNGVFAEEAIKTLLANPDDALYLVRQSSDWLEKKKEQFA